MCVIILLSNLVAVFLKEVIAMFMEERQQEIAEAIARSGKILIAEIVEKYHISDESARRDLRMLEQKGLCLSLIHI